MKRLFTFLSIALLCLGLSAAVSEKTASYGLLLSDDGNTIVMNSASNLIVYLPSLGTGNIGYTVTVMKKGTGQVKIQAPLADYVGDSLVNGYIQNTTASTDASITLHLGKLNYWYVTGATGVWATSVSSSPYGVASPTYGTVWATTFDTNVAAAAVTLAGTTLSADGTDAAINIAITPKGTGEVDMTKVDIDGGAIDGTTIGAASATTGAFSTVTATTVNATTLDTNVAAAGVTLAGTTLAADGTDAAINIAITPKGTGEVDITKVDIDAGTIDGATIATSDVTVGAGKTLDVSAGTLTLADNQISGDKVEGGTIAATTITTLTSTTANVTTLDTNIAAAGVTLAGTTLAADGTDTDINIAITPKGTGEVDITKVDIDSGAIDGTTIGANSAAAVTGTTITGTTVTTGGAGAAAATGNVATENALGTVHSTVLTLTNVAIAPAAAAAGVAFGNVKLYDFPEGYVYYVGAVADLAITDATSAGAEMAGNFATWTAPVAPASWDYDSTTAGAWHHATGDDTALTTDVTPVAGTTYTVAVTMATTTAGGGLVVSMGGVAQSEVHGTETASFTFTASDATVLTLTPASGTWVGDVTAVSVTSGSPVSATWDGDIALGTTADADGSLASTEVDLIASTATPQASASATTGDCVSTATEIAIFDGHSTAKDLYLNLLIDDVDFVDAGTGALLLNGTITVTWIKLGDN